MKFLVYSAVGAAQIATNLGAPEYSYYFVLKEFLPVLRTLGEVIVIENPQSEVNRLYARAIAAKEECVFLSFSPPHKTELNLRCPTIPVFAWEFDSIPNESWLGDMRQDWRYSLGKVGMAITHSQLTVGAVKKELGDNYPVISIPAPVWDKYANFRANASGAPRESEIKLKLSSGFVLDSHTDSLAPYLPGPEGATGGTTVPTSASVAETPKRLEPINQVEPAAMHKLSTAPLAPDWELGEAEVVLDGVVFTSMFNPYDGRKNWMDMLTAFCTAFRDTPDATLLFKLGHIEYQSAMSAMVNCMSVLPPFKCRVILLQGYLDGQDFEALIRATAFIVNASHGEGQCLPLMEFLSCGKPAVAPCHSAMIDYIDSDVAFVVDSWLDASAWSHDPRLAYRTRRHQISWESLVKAYESAYRCFITEPERYHEMSRNAIDRMQAHCSQETAKIRLRNFFKLPATLPESSH